MLHYWYLNIILLLHAINLNIKKNFEFVLLIYEVFVKWTKLILLKILIKIKFFGLLHVFFLFYLQKLHNLWLNIKFHQKVCKIVENNIINIFISNFNNRIDNNL